MGKYDFDEFIDRSNTNSMNVEGWRSYIFGADCDRVFPYRDDEFVRMWIADMEFAVAPEICDAIRERLDRRIFGYTAIYDEDFYKAFSEWCMNRYGWEMERDNLVFSPGVIPALYQLTEDITSPGDKVMTLTPAYGYFLRAADYAGADMVECPLQIENGRFVIDREDFAGKAADPDLKMIYFCNPHNPTGRVWTREELDFIAGEVRKNNLWLISDEIHCDILRTGKTHTTMATVMPDYDRLIVCMSASKTFNIAGMLLSEIFIRNDAERTKFKIRDKLLGSTNPLSAAAHKAAYQKGGEWLAEFREYIDGNMKTVKDFLSENLPDAVYEIADSTYFAWIDLSKCLPGVEYVPDFFAENAGVLLEGDDRLFVGNARGYVRLNLAMRRSVVRTGLERMKKAIDEYNAGRIQ